MRVGTLMTATAGAALGLVIVSCGDGAIDMIGDAMMDGGMIGDASAQSCASCTASGAVRMITADTDPEQFVGGIVEVEDSNPDTLVVTGPFVLTDAMATAGDGRLFLYTLGAADNGGACADVPLADGAVARLESTSGDGDDAEIHGARIFIPAGQLLCASRLSGAPALRWAGFRPY